MTLKDDSTEATMVLFAYEEGRLTLDEAAARLAPLPVEAFRDDSLNYERGFPQEWVDRMLVLNAAVQRLRANARNNGAT